MWNIMVIKYVSVSYMFQNYLIRIDKAEAHIRYCLYNIKSNIEYNDSDLD